MGNLGTITPEEEKRIETLVKKAVADLQEAGCDAVQILVSYRVNESTGAMSQGSGNWYARKGMAQEFLEKGQAATNAQAIGEILSEEE